MMPKPLIPITPRIEEAIEEFKALILSRYPEATFSVEEGYDPVGIYLTATVDVDDIDAVFDLIVDRLGEVQVEEEMPLFVIPTRPLARTLEMLDRMRDDALAPLPTR